MLAMERNASASPAADRYVRTIAMLPSPISAMPAAPTGYGAVRDERAGNVTALRFQKTIARREQVTRYSGKTKVR